MIPRIKICCISSSDEAKMAIKFGAAALGLVANMPSGPGVITDEEILKIAQSVPPAISTFMLTSETSAEEIIEHHKRTLTNTIQIVDELKEGTYQKIREVLPAIKIVQVIHVIDELGGTGRVHNWALSRKIVEQSKVPVFLAGGLKAENVRQAIEQVQPFGIDLCSGVRSDNKLDPRKLETFFTTLSKCALQ